MYDIPKDVFWATDEGVTRGDVSPRDDARAYVATTSWQQLLLSGYSGHHHVIRPAVTRSIDADDRVPPVRRSVGWAGDANDGSLAMLVAVADGMRRSGAEPVTIHAFPTTQPLKSVMDLVNDDVHIAVGAKPDVVERVLSHCAVYAAPSMSATSFDREAALAATYGALVVAPKKYGYPEVFGGLAYYPCIHSYDNATYAASFASVLNEALHAALVVSRGEASAAAVAKFAEDRVKFEWEEFLGFLKMADAVSFSG